MTGITVYNKIVDGTGASAHPILQMLRQYIWSVFISVNGDTDLKYLKLILYRNLMKTR